MLEGSLFEHCTPLSSSASDLSLDHRFWLQATPPWWLALEEDSWEEPSLPQVSPTATPAGTRVSRGALWNRGDGKDDPSLPPLNELVDDWVRGRLSNFDYLMALNQVGVDKSLPQGRFLYRCGD